MASLPCVTLSATLKLEPELRRHPSSAPSLLSEKSPSILHQRSPMNTRLDGGFEHIRPLEFKEALSLIKEGEKIESSYYVPLLQQCIDKNSVLGAQTTHAHMIKTGTHQQFFVMTFLVNVYAKCGDMASARKVFDNLPRRNVVAWSTLMSGYVQSSQPELAIDVFKEMLESGSFPSNYTLGIALNACASLNSMKLGKQFHAFIIKYKIDHDASIGNAICTLYSKFGSLVSAVRAFRRIGEKNVISWTAIICACEENGKAAKGLRFFVDMLHENIRPNEFTLTSVLSLCCTMLSMRVGAQVHSLCIKLGYESNLHIMNSVMYLYLKCGYIDKAQYVFNTMESASLVTWNAMIAGHAKAMGLARDNLSAYESGTEALRIFLNLNRSGMRPDIFSLSSVFTVCSRLASLEPGEQVHAQAIKSGFLSDVVVGTALVYMYSKCGSIDRARKAFVEMSTRTLISWTAMITSFAQHGLSQQALQVFEDMRLAGYRPNHITFVGVLAACSQAGMVDEALQYLELMQKEYRIKPVMDHYRCLIDMFVKLGKLDEAFNVVKKMDFEPSEHIWLLLIEGCKHHGNLDLGFYAAEQLLKLKPKDNEAYLMV